MLCIWWRTCWSTGSCIIHQKEVWRFRPWPPVRGAV